MTPAVYDFVKGLPLDRLAPTLDIGSYDVNGSVRDLFENYTGLDMREGPNVDVVEDAHTLGYTQWSFINVLCLEMLEHDSDPVKTIKEMYRVLEFGGHAVITARGIGFPHHDYPHDYWRFTADGLRLLMFRAGFQSVQVHEDHEDMGVFGFAQKTIR